MVECLGLAVVLAELAKDTEGTVVAGCPLFVLPHGGVVGPAEAVPAVRLAEPVSELLAQGQSLVAVHLPALGVAEPDVVPAHGVEDLGLPGLVAGGLEQDQGLLVVAERFADTVLLLADDVEGLMGA